MAEDFEVPSSLVIDASVVLAFLLPDEERLKVDLVFKLLSEGKTRIYVPVIFKFEIFNGLKTAVLRKRISAGRAKKLIVNFLQMPFEEKKIDWVKTFKLAVEKGLSFYDASYLFLAQKEKLVFYTLDKKLEKLAGTL